MPDFPANSQKGRFSHSILVVLIISLIAFIVLRWHQEVPVLYSIRNWDLPIKLTLDSDYYAAMATEGLAQIPSPFSKRVLYSALAGFISKSTDATLPTAFLILNTIALLALAFCLAEILRLTIGKPLLALPFLLTPFTIISFELAYLPDLFHMALTSIFFLLLLHRKNALALVILFLAFLTRENTMILCLFIIGLAWWRNEKKLSLGALAVLIVGMAAGSIFVKMGQPNRHHMPDFLYLIGKIPYYFLLNFFGVRVWSDVRPGVGTPLITWQLPDWMHRICVDRIIGITAPEWLYPVHLLMIWLALFGIGPLVLYFLIRKFRQADPAPFVIQLALTYGIFSFVIGPLLGDWILRLIGYGWPAFWIALPFLLYKSKVPLKTSRLVALLAAFLVISWWPPIFHYDNTCYANPWPALPALLIYLPTFKILRGEARKHESR